MTENQPIALPIELKKCGYLLKQIQRNDFAAVYSVTDIATGAAHGYEVFEIQYREPTTYPNGTQYPMRERYPNAEAFGDWAKAPRHLDRALQLFKDFTERAQKKAEKGLRVAI
jgi:hypothetical protein